MVAQSCHFALWWLTQSCHFSLGDSLSNVTLYFVTHSVMSLLALVAGSVMSLFTWWLAQSCHFSLGGSLSHVAFHLGDPLSNVTFHFGSSLVNQSCRFHQCKVTCKDKDLSFSFTKETDNVSFTKETDN